MESLPVDNIPSWAA